MFFILSLFPNRSLDFGTGDMINLRGVFSSINYTGTNAIADGILQFQQLGANTVVQVSANALGNNLINLVTVNNTGITAVNNSFIF